MDTDEPNDEKNLPSGLDPKAAAGQVRRLTVSRIVALTAPFGMLVTQVVLAVVGLIMLLGGRTDVLHAFLTILPTTAAFVGGGWISLQGIDRRLVNLAHRVTAPEMCPPLLEMMPASLMLGRIRPQIEAGLAASLATIDADWWEQNARLMRRHVTTALSAVQRADRLSPVDGPWLPALLDAIERTGRTEFLERIEKLERAATRLRLPDELVQAIPRCAESLRLRKECDRQAAQLLRPASYPGDNLLRPASATTEPIRTDYLLRPSERTLPEEAAPTIAAQSPTDTPEAQQVPVQSRT